MELATEVAQVYFDDRLPVHSLVLPNGNLEDTLNFINWNMEERLVSFVVIREMNLLFRYGDTWGCYVIRDWRRYIWGFYIMYPTQSKPNQPNSGSGLISTPSSCLVGNTSW